MDVASSAEKRHCKICARLFPTVTEYAKHLKENHIPKINPVGNTLVPNVASFILSPL